MPGPATHRLAASLGRRGRWNLLEVAFWLAAAATLFFLPERHLILNEITIIGLFAVSLDLILGYVGIVSLGHAAFFGLGAYAAGITAKLATGDPTVGLLAAAAAAALLGFVTSFLVLRGADLTRLMVTLGVALLLGEIANQASWLTGGADGLQGIMMNPILGWFEFDIFGTVAYTYSLVVTFILFVIARRIVASPFGLSLRSIRDNPLRARAIGIPVNRRLVAIYTISAAYAGVAGALLAQTTQFVSLDVIAFHRSADVLLVLVIGGVGYLYGGLIGAIVFKVLQDLFSSWTPQYWQFWLGLILVVLVLAGRERLSDRVRGLWSRAGSRSVERAGAAGSASVREI
jgi:branched-chain amino acid transport system permease protein